MFQSNNKFRKAASLAAMLASGILSAGFLGGCANTGAHTIATGSSESIVTVNQIDDQDWANAATSLTNSMLSQSDLFASNIDGSKKRLGISRIINNTSQVVDTDLLINQVRITLNKSGKVITSTLAGLNTEDPLAKRNNDIQNFTQGDGTATVKPVDYSLSGKLIETQAKAGDIHQATFYFKLTLSNSSGDAIWEDQKSVTKIGSHNSVGL